MSTGTHGLIYNYAALGGKPVSSAVIRCYTKYRYIDRLECVVFNVHMCWGRRAEKLTTQDNNK